MEAHDAYMRLVKDVCTVHFYSVSSCRGIVIGFVKYLQLWFPYRIDVNNVIKVADFGLSEGLYARNYYRQTKEEGTKLPMKWMAIESLHDGIFSEKSDVVSYRTPSV